MRGEKGNKDGMEEDVRERECRRERRERKGSEGDSGAHRQAEWTNKGEVIVYSL